MKVCWVCPCFYPAMADGGPPISGYILARAVAERGVEVSVTTTNADGDTILEGYAGRTVALEPHLSVTYHPRTHGRHSLAQLRRLWRDIGRADVVRIQEMFTPASLCALWICRLRRKQALLAPAGSIGDWALEQGRIRLKQFWLRRLVSPALSAVTFHATADTEVRDVKKRLPYGRVSLIPNAIRVDEFDNPATVSRQELMQRFARSELAPDYVVVSMGRLHRMKGFDLLIDAFADLQQEHPNGALLIAGPDRGLQGALSEQIARRGIVDRCHFIGVVRDQDKVTLLASADLLALSSRHENFGMVYAEALASGTPIVASRKTPWAGVETAGCGFWVPPTADAFRRAMGQVLAGDPAEMGRRGRRWIREQFGSVSIGERLERLLRKLVEG